MHSRFSRKDTAQNACRESRADKKWALILLLCFQILSAPVFSAPAGEQRLDPGTETALAAEEEEEETAGKEKSGTFYTEHEVRARQNEMELLKKNTQRSNFYLLLTGGLSLLAIVISLLIWRYWKHSRKNVLALTDLNVEIHTKNRQLERSIKLLNVSQSLSKTAGWEYNLQTGEIFLTRQAYLLYDLDPDFVPTLDSLRLLYGEKEKDILDAIALSTIKKNEPYRVETEIMTARRVKKWIRVIAEPLVSDGRIVGSIGAVQDITDEKRAERLQKDLTAHLQTLITSLEDIVFEIDGNKIFRHLWVRDEAMLFAPKDSFVGRSFKEVFGPFWQMFSDPVEQVLETGEPLEFEYKHIDKEIDHWYKSTIKLMHRAEDPLQTRLVVSIQDITQPYLQDIALREAKAKLEQSNRDKDRIMRVLVHDLRSPLSGMHSVSAMMLKKNSFSPADQEMISVINDTSLFLFDMVNDLVEVSLSQETTLLKREDLDMQTLVRQCIYVLQFKANEKHQQIRVQAEGVLRVSADAQKIQRVLNNLVSNAIKFSPNEAVITIRLAKTYKGIRLSVEDQGIGIPEELKAKVFDVFTEAKRYGTNSERPFGLGLSICKQIIEAHGGLIWFESEPGRGTVFFIELP